MAGAIAVTGGRGRLGRALLAALAARQLEAVAWSRPDYDLDDPAAARRVVTRDHPATVIHAAAWTDVEGAADDPALAMRRNAAAVAELAGACADDGARLVLISTNEVFDGRRQDGRGYREDDSTNPINAYGASKLAGEAAARRAFTGDGSRLWIARTAWLFGPPGADFPTKILAAADALPPGTPLRVVTDEIGSPTYTLDLASALLELVATAPAGTYHLAGSGTASRLDVARMVLDACRPGTEIEPISRQQFERRSTPPAWAVLDGGRAAGHGITLRDWRAAVHEYVAPLALEAAR